MPTKPEPQDQNYIFNCDLAEFTFYGDDDAAKARNAMVFKDLRNVAQRYWQQFTRDELDAIKISMQNCIIEDMGQ